MERPQQRCAVCATLFTPERSNQGCCSEECEDRYRADIRKDGGRWAEDDAAAIAAVFRRILYETLRMEAPKMPMPPEDAARIATTLTAEWIRARLSPPAEELIVP